MDVIFYLYLIFGFMYDMGLGVGEVVRDIICNYLFVFQIFVFGLKLILIIDECEFSVIVLQVDFGELIVGKCYVV